MKLLMNNVSAATIVVLERVGFLAMRDVFVPFRADGAINVDLASNIDACDEYQYRRSHTEDISLQGCHTFVGPC